jgi:hypothetical protein
MIQHDFGHWNSDHSATFAIHNVAQINVWLQIFITVPLPDTSTHKRCARASTKYVMLPLHHH